MKHIAFLILTLIRQVKGDVQYQSGYSNYWYSIEFPSVSTYTQTITFPQLFSRIPQVAINPIIISDIYSNKAQAGYELSVSQVTISGFQVNMYVPVNKMYYLTFYWLAVDDKRIEILQNFNVANPQSTILEHNNPNVDTGIIFFTSFYGTTILDFTLNLGTITSNTVEVNIVQQNMISLGYIIILGPSEFLDIEEQIIQPPKDEDAADVYKSRQVTRENNKLWLYFIQYFTFNIDKEIRIQLKPINQTLAYSSYKFCAWWTSDVCFVAAAHQCATLNFDLTTLQPMLFQKVRISGLILRVPSNTFEFSIQGVNFIYIPVIANYQILVPKNLQSITFMIKVKCNQNYKITAQFYQCSSCSKNYKTIVKQCYHSEISLQFYVTYINQNANFKQHLFVNMTPTQLQIFQKVYTQVVIDQTLICQYNIE